MRSKFPSAARTPQCWIALSPAIRAKRIRIATSAFPALPLPTLTFEPYEHLFRGGLARRSRYMLRHKVARSTSARRVPGLAACYLRPERISWPAYFFDLESSFLMDRCTRLAQFNTDTLPSEGAAVQLLCEDHIGTYTLPFLCLRSENGWVDAETSSPIDAGVLGWREPPATLTTRQPVWAHRLSMLRTFRSRTPGERR